MAKKGCASGCLRVFIVMIVCVGLLAAGGYFGGNILIKKYLGDEGEFAQMGINNWHELIEAYNGLKNITNATPPVVANEDKPTSENKTQADAKLNESIDGYNSDTGLLGGDIVFNSKLVLTGGELAAIMESEREKADGIAAFLPFEFSVYAVSLSSSSTAPEADPVVYDLSTITIVLEIDSSVIKALINSSGVPGASIISGSIADGKMYMSIGNGLKSEDGAVALNTAAAKTVVLNDGSAANEKILNIILTVSGYTKNQLADDFATALSDVLNGIGKVTFAKDEAGASVVEFDNKYNSGIIQTLGFFADVDIEQDFAVAKDAIIEIKNTVGQIRAILSKTQLENGLEVSVPVDAAAIEAEWLAYTEAYAIDDSASLTELKDKADALLAVLTA